MEHFSHKKWRKPKLIVFLRKTMQEAVLVVCKDLKSPMGVGQPQFGQQNGCTSGNIICGGCWDTQVGLS